MCYDVCPTCMYTLFLAECNSYSSTSQIKNSPCNLADQRQVVMKLRRTHVMQKGGQETEVGSRKGSQL